ncbi:zinc ribbon domain-containing protein [Geobacter sp. DSM 9736]|uniref:FmdB family zinc ribbon protein n=1 Tax=Geobacter sp. DSM 9736 TaxID=1277350 RepID=UPI000B501D5F|nr:zinc ribbon domain-containing protein [Geobacter sp. DSM 9736]SNB46577.1 putative regulatory protein, FmdB family [Geobacter sp. DSM 9736]
MPVYEFYCSDCHTIYNFLSRRIAGDRQPVCPRCGKEELERQVSRFALSQGRKEEPEEGMPDVDESRLEKAIMSLAGELDGMDEGNPRQVARFMRRLSHAAGVNFGSGIEEVIARLEAGEDPQKIEDEMGTLLEEENPFSREGIKGLRRRYTPPAHDDTLYPFE